MRVAHGRRAIDTVRLWMPPAACLVVEDAPAGLAAAHAAGMRALAVATTHPPAALGDAELIAQALSAVSIRVERSGCRDVSGVAVSCCME